MQQEMYRNCVPAGNRTGIKDSVPVPGELIPTGTGMIVANTTDLFRNIPTLSLHGKIDVGCHLLRDRTY